MMSTLSLRSWLLGARPAPDENRLHIWGLLLVGLNVILWWFGWMCPGSGIGIADHYPYEAINMLPGYALLVPLLGPLLFFGLLFLRRLCKKCWSYYACTGLMLGLTLAALLVVVWNFWAVGYIYENFQPLY